MLIRRKDISEDKCQGCGESSKPLYRKDGCCFYTEIEFYCQKCFKDKFEEDPEEWKVPDNFKLGDILPKLRKGKRNE